MKTASVLLALTKHNSYIAKKARTKVLKCGIIAPNGMVGKVFMPGYRLIEKSLGLHTTIFTRSDSHNTSMYDREALCQMDILVNMAPSSYAHPTHHDLRSGGWHGYWVDASSALRSDPETCLALPPVNGRAMMSYLHGGGKDFSGANCTTSLLCIALKGLIEQQAIAEIFVSTYQSLSGAGKEALTTYQDALSQADLSHRDPYDFMSDNYQNTSLQHLCPWIDDAVSDGRTKEEFKMTQEIKKLTQQDIRLEAICVRVPILRTHAQSAFITLHKPMSLADIRQALTHPLNRLIDNTQEATKAQLDPKAVFDTDIIHTGRLRQLSPTQINLYTIGDQLQWGAAKPLLETVSMIVQHHQSQN